jgi:hypothetical protein
MKKDKKSEGKDKEKAKDVKKDSKRDTKEDDGEKQRLAKLEATIQSLHNNQLPALRHKLPNSTEATKVLKAAQKALRLNTIDLFGPGICDATVKDLCQTLRTLSGLTYLGLRNYSIDSNSAYNGISYTNYRIILMSLLDVLKTISQHKQLSTLHIDLLVSTKLKIPDLLPSIRDSLLQSSSITKFSLMGRKK